MLPLIPIIARAHSAGMRVDKVAAQKALSDLETLLGDYVSRAQASVGWPINLGSPPQVQKQLYEVEGLKPKRRSWNKDGLFKINNNISPYLARDLVRRYPGLRNLIEMRTVEGEVA
jgi:DNA polymerase I-like protein with 3'-5' exonuclease and polymerase domains